MSNNKVFKFCSKCGSKLIRKVRGVNVFGEVTYDLVCPQCKFSWKWEEICPLVKNKKEVKE